MNELMFGANGDRVGFDVVDAHGDRWVLASQVGEALGVQNIWALVTALSQSEGLKDGVHYSRVNLGSVEKVVQDNGAKNRERLLLSYRGVIRVAMRSDGPRAVQFRDWAEDVLYAALVRPSGRVALPESQDGGDVDRRYRQAAAIVKATMGAGKSLGVPARDLRSAAVDAAATATGVQFGELLSYAPGAPGVSEGAVIEFLGECCVVGTGYSTAPVALYLAYQGWAGDYGYVPLSRNRFYAAVQDYEPGITRMQTGPNRTRVFGGVCLAYEEVV